MPDHIPWYSLGPSIGLMVNFIFCLLSLIFYIFHSRYRPLRSLFFFYLSLSAYFLGYAGYGYQASSASIIFWYRIMLLGLAWMPATWLLFVGDLHGRPGAPFFATATTVALLATAALIFVHHPAVLGLPLEEVAGAGVQRPQSWLIRPLIQLFDLGVITISLILIPLRWWPGPNRPKFIQPMLLGLVLWLLGGLHDAAFSMGLGPTFQRTILWLTSSWLSLCLAVAVAIYFRILDRKLAESTRMLHLVLNTIPLSVYWKDAELKYLGANRRFTELAGLKDPTEIIGRSDDQLPWTEETRQALTQDDRQAMDSEAALEARRRRLTAGQDKLWFSTNRAPLRNDEGRTVGVLGTLEDITSQVAAEARVEELQQQLFQSQKMEAVGTLTGGIAHDFNNLIQAISGYALLLQQDNDTHPVKAEYASEIDRASARAAELVRGLLTFSRKVEPKLTGVNLNSEIDQAVRMLARIIPKMVDIETDLAENLPQVHGDPNQLGQILMNLGTNARDAMPQGGKLIYSTSVIDLDDEAVKARPGLTPGRYVRLRVSDTGTGMPKKVLNKIFEPFFTTKGAGKGTGLGLAVIYGIIRSHQGHIQADSEPGRGTVFTILLPVWQGQETTALPEEEPKPEASGGTETILLVDDERPIRQLVAEVLEMEGYKVLTAASGEEALEIYQTHGADIDLTILDLGMPGMGGKKALEELILLDARAKVVISSGFSDPEMIEDLKKAGATGFLPKPFRVTSLPGLIRELLDRD